MYLIVIGISSSSIYIYILYLKTNAVGLDDFGSMTMEHHYNFAYILLLYPKKNFFCLQFILRRTNALLSNHLPPKVPFLLHLPQASV